MTAIYTTTATEPSFQLILTSAASQGFIICTNLWFMYERQYIFLGFVVAIKPKSTITSHFYYA